MLPVLDAYSRPLGSLRISVTDRCNLRCDYCMPQEEYVWLERDELLSFEEIAQLASVFTGVGVNKIRLTGGEPLLRRDLDRLVGLLRQNSQITDLALTTNGVTLAQHAEALHAAGLRRITVSLDTLGPERFRALTRRDQHARVVEGIDAAQRAGFSGTKVNAVVIRGFNEDELCDLIEFGREHNVEVRFIEYMDVGGALRWSTNQVYSRQEMLRDLAARYGPVTPIPRDGSAPAEEYTLPDGTRFGIISSTTEPFCGTCDRARLTADGMLFLCLYARDGVDLKHMLRGGAREEEIADAIRHAWTGRRDRGAEQRLHVPARTALFQIQELRQDPRKEMHTRGG
jgi:GTP 3',8-cyclase